MLNSKFLKYLFIYTLIYIIAYFCFVLFLDPFGVSPINFTFNRINKYKPVRQNIDRLIKPYEVWRYQPRTIFLGTSRIHQSIDPAVLSETQFAPAYNASIPASTLGLNVAHLKQFIDLDPHLKTVVIELFFYNFISPEDYQNSISSDEFQQKKFSDFLYNTFQLFVSSDALWGAIKTLGYNIIKNKPTHEIKPNGFFYYPPGYNAKGSFDGFPAGIWKIHHKNGIKLEKSSFEAVDEIINICKKNKIQLIFILTPNHTYFDYYFERNNMWPLIDEWLNRLVSKNITIYNFSQPNSWVYEPVSNNMIYWYDPSHFSLKIGKAIQESIFFANKNNNIPDNFFVQLNSKNIKSHILERRSAVKYWSVLNPEFILDYESERNYFEGNPPFLNKLVK